MAPAILDGPELADRIGTTHESVMAWHRCGAIPSIKTSNRIYFNLDRVVEALRQMRAAEEAAAGRP